MTAPWQRDTPAGRRRRPGRTSGRTPAAMPPADPRRCRAPFAKARSNTAELSCRSAVWATIAACAREKRSCGCRAATRSAASGVSTSSSGGSSGHGEPEVEQPRQLGGTGSRRGHRDAGEHARRPVPAQSDRPEPAVVTQPEHGIRAVPVGVEQAGGDLRGVHPDQQGPVGPHRARHVARHTERSRRTPRRAAPSGRRPAAVRPRSRRPTGRGCPARRAPGAEARERRTAVSVSRRAASASLAASTGLNRDCSRVFTRPGTGSLASTTTASARSISA